MLQIVTGMYFRDVELRETKHRGVFYSNGTTLHADDIELPIGRFLFSSSIAPVTPVTIEAVERLEAVRPDGTPEMLISTGGEELLNDAATVIAFSLNLTCSRNLSLVERVVPKSPTPGEYRRPSNILRRTFDPEVVISATDIEKATEFCSKLIASSRRHFEAALRAIKRVVDATYLVSDDPALAYTLFVTSLESLAQISTSPEEARSWDTYEPEKRRIIDAATTDLTHEQTKRVRDAVLEIDQMSLGRRFREFVLDHVQPAFYRSEAADAARPIRVHDLPNALTVAYKLRSRNVHELQVLEPELWVITDRSDTIRFEDRWVLSLEGLNRLCRHVIATFVGRAPTEIDRGFNYRDHLPGIVRLPLAAQHWIGNSEGFTPAEAPRFLTGFLELLLPVMAGDDGAEIVDITGVLEKIERALPGEQRPEVRRPMIAIYILWHKFLKTEHHRPRSDRVIERFAADLDAPSMTAFAVRLLTGKDLNWTDDELRDLVEARRRDVQRGRGQKLPDRFDPALLLCLAQRRWKLASDEARSLISEAVESLPGDAGLIEIEREARSGQELAVDLLGFLLDADEPDPSRDEASNRDRDGALDESRESPP
jgi:hypothetical protein